MTKKMTLATAVIGVALVAYAMAAGAQALKIKSARENSGGVAIVTVETDRPMSKTEMEANTRKIASKYGYRAMTVMYEVPAPPEKADYMDFVWRGKAQLYPSGEVNVIGGK